jgi:microcystin-dependent protein
MAKTKISEFSSTAADNTDITNINIAEGCSPANVNNAIRSLMSVLKNQQDGSSGDPFTVAGTFNATGGFQLDGTAGASGQVLLSAGSGNTPTWGNAFVAGMIMLWSGSSASIPSGWLLCDGSNSTPDLRNRFVVGAGSTYAVDATGGSANAIVVSHTHSVSDPGHAHVYTTPSRQNDVDRGTGSSLWSIDIATNYNTSSVGTGISINSAGSSGTNANLPPYYALCYIMKS